MQSFPEFIVEAKKLTKDDAKELAGKLESRILKPKASSGNIMVAMDLGDFNVKVEDVGFIGEIFVKRKKDKLYVEESYILEYPDSEIPDKTIKKIAEDLGTKVEKGEDETFFGQQNEVKDMDEAASTIDFAVGKMEAAAKTLEKGLK